MESIRKPFLARMATAAAFVVFGAFFNAYAQTAGTLTISTFAGNGSTGLGTEDVPATSGQFSYPAGIGIDTERGRVYIADQFNNRVRVVTTDGLVSTVVGSGIQCPDSTKPCGDDGPAKSAQLNNPIAVGVDSSGDLYIADLGDFRIRKVTIASGIITTIAGNGVFGDGPDGPALSAKLGKPFGLAVDAAKNVYIADADNHRVRKLSNGILRTIAGDGTPGPIVNGVPATSSQLAYPVNVALDSAGNVYIVDTNQYAVRKVTVATGLFSTVAGGLGVTVRTGENVPATSVTFGNPQGIAVDAAGNVYIADSEENRIRKVTAATGLIATLAGTGVHGFGGDNGPPSAAQLAFPTRIALAAGSIYIADADNNRIRQITDSSTLPTLTSMSPNSGTAGTSVNVSFTGTNFMDAYGVSAGTGIRFDNVAISSVTIVRATFILSATAAPGPRSVTVRTLAGTSNPLTFTVLALPTPSFSLSGAPPTVDAQQQLGIGLSLDSPYSTPVTGTLKLTAVDPNVQFSSGGQTAFFTVGANQRQAVFGSANTALFSTGTVAGDITFTATLAMNGETFAANVPVSRLTVADKAPTITAVSASLAGGTLTLTVTGFSTSRQVSRATFTFTGANVDTQPVNVDVNSTFVDWYGKAESRAYGSSFTLTVPFTATGGAIPSGRVTATLTNARSEISPAVGANY